MGNLKVAWIEGRGVLGALRFIFALMVVFSHLGGMAGGIQKLDHLGFFAVFGFYLLSGYLMTLVLHEVYRFNFLEFASNRFLRIFPSYYFVAAATMLVIAWGPPVGRFQLFPHDWDPDFRNPATLDNLLIFPLISPHSQFMLVPPAWSLAVELVVYFILWLIIARHQTAAVVTVLLSLAYHASSLWLGRDWSMRYYTLSAALLPFSIGTLIYFYRDLLLHRVKPWMGKLAGISFAIWLANLVACGFFSGLGEPGFDAFFYLNLASLAVLVLCLAHPDLERRFKGAGKFLGSLSYPIFLTHWLVGFLVARTVFPHLRYGNFGIGLAIASLPAILATSYLLHRYMEQRVEPLREKLKARIALFTQFES
jgi:peptidoglycan/LPS O-acetylase OafA/YrhL